MTGRELGRTFGRAVRDGADVAAIAFVALAEAEVLDGVTAAEHADLFVAWTQDWTGRAGTIVRQDGRLYRSIHDVGPGQNTPPGDTPAMWTPLADPGDEWPAWSAPIGAHDAYVQGFKVTHAGVRWVSDLGGNVWEPGVFGWTQA